MRIKVLAFATFREILGKEREVDLPGSASVKELLEALAATSPRFKEAAFEPSGALRDYVLRRPSSPPELYGIMFCSW
ncbi:MAG: molybdopterin synthase sulfur carrier subunit [Methanosaeta sp. NSM2]|nr:MoaD/ThiS family protein [Methanothrix sp.]OYV13837.1 MAG: molybdopterin synthase sulfur carrier subunit [Methanosaeta sp. NSM2]